MMHARLLLCRACAAVLGAVLLVGCTTRPSKVRDAPKVAPDEQYEVGGTWADRFLIWHCYEGQRVAMIQACSPHSCADWRVFRGPCGTPTTGEQTSRTQSAARDAAAARDRADASSDDDEHAKHHPIPDGSGWR